MKNILLLTIAILGITACNSSSGNTKKSIALTSKCSDTNDTSNYQVLQSGDIVSKPETLNTENVCIKSGTAVILR